jgi:hypothetical protein
VKGFRIRPSLTTKTMKKKVTYLFGTIISLIASVFSSATASACGGDAGYIPEKAYKDEKSYSDGKSYYDDKSYTDSKTYLDEKSNSQVYTSKKGKSSVFVTSRPSNKVNTGKIFLDGMEAPVALTKEAKSERERILKAIKEMGCFITKNPNFAKTEDKMKTIFTKHGIKTDEASMKALEARYGNDATFLRDVEKAASCKN